MPRAAVHGVLHGDLPSKTFVRRPQNTIMLVRLLSSLFIFVLNSVSGLAAQLRKRCDAAEREAALRRPNSPSGLTIGREIVDLADVSPSPALGGWQQLRFADLLMHLYAVGRTGSGKTSLLTVLVDAYVRSGQTFVIIDARGDL